MTNTAAIQLRQTERAITFTLTLPRPWARRRPLPKVVEPRRERPFGLTEAAYAAQRPWI